MRLAFYYEFSERYSYLIIFMIIFVVAISTVIAFAKGAIIPPLPLPADYVLAVVDGGISSMILIVAGYIAYTYARFLESIIDSTPRLLDDMVSAMKSGANFLEALRTIARLSERYGVLGHILRNAYARIEVAGMPPSHALETALKEFPHPWLSRIIYILMEAYHAGPQALNVLEVATHYYTRIRIVRERYKTLIRTYLPIFLLSYLMFISLSYLMIKVFLPGFAQLKIGGPGFTMTVNMQLVSYSFYWLGFILAIGMGLMYGKIVWLKTSAGFLYAGLMLLLNTVIYALFILGPITLPLPGAIGPALPPLPTSGIP